MTTEYQERPRKGFGTECMIPSDRSLWRRLLPNAFSTEKAQQVYDGRKTQMRQLMNPQPTYQGFKSPPKYSSTFGDLRYPGQVGFTPRYRVGDVLWVQEPWRTFAVQDKWKPTSLPPNASIYYEGSPRPAFSRGDAGKLRPAITLPLRFARPARYEVTDVRCERVNRITQSDAEAEGIISGDGACDRFGDLWNSINTKPGTRFEDGPWVFVYAFKRIL